MELSKKQVRLDDKVTSLVNIRKKNESLVLHLVNYTSYSSRPIMDIVSLNDLQVSVAKDKKPSKVRTLRGEKELDFTFEDGIVKFIVPEVKEYEIVVLE